MHTLTPILRATTVLLEHKQRLRATTMRREISRKLHEQQTEDTEADLTRALQPYFKRQLASAHAELLKQHTATNGETLAKLVFDPTEWEDELIDIVSPILAEHMSEAVIAYFLSLGIDIRRGRKAKAIVVDEPEAEDVEDLPIGISTELPLWMQLEITDQLEETFSQPYWSDIPVTTQQNLATYFGNSLIDGLSIEQMAKGMLEHFTGYDKMRAKRIARTETGNALNGARNAAYERMKAELPEDVSQHINKSWLSVLGNTTRDDHANLDGEMADEDGMFVLGGVSIPWPGHWSLPPENRINCQCSLLTEMGAGAPGSDELEELLSQDAL